MRHILLVEDNDLFAAALLRYLSAHGAFDLERHSNADDALKRIRAFCPDLVLTDLSMPNHDGFWLLRRLHRSFPSLACLMISGFDDREFAGRALETGALGYVVKDDMPGILEGVDAALRGQTFVSRVLRHGPLPNS